MHPKRLGTTALQCHRRPVHFSDMQRLQHKCYRLRLLATCSITITNKQNHNVIDYDYDYIVSTVITITIAITIAITFVLKHPQKKTKPICKVLCKYIFRQHTT